MHKRVRTPYICSFCGKAQDKVQRLIAGPGGVYICDECIDLCRDIIEKEVRATQQEPTSETTSTKQAAMISCGSCGVACPATYNYCFNCGKKLRQEP